MKKILFCCYGGGHVQALLPIIQYLKENKSYDIRVFALTTAQDILRSHNIDFFSYKDLPWCADPIIKDLGEILKNTLTISKINENETVAYLGANMNELIEVNGTDNAHTMYKQEGRSCFYPLSLMKKLLNHEQPDLVVATNSPRTERAIIQAASDLSIPALCIVDSFAKYEADWISSPDFGDAVCVLSDSVKKRFIDHKRPKTDIYVTGNPAFDPFLTPVDEKIQTHLKEKIGVEPGQIILMYAPSPEGNQHIFTKEAADPELPYKILQELLSFIACHSRFFLIIRPHPSQVFHVDSTIKNIFYDQGNDLKSMLSVTDTVITLGSTVGIQAQLMGKRLICCNQSVYANDTKYEDFGDLRRIYSFKELEREILEGAEKKEHSRINHNIQRSATEKIIDIIESMLNKNANKTQ